MKKTVLKTSFLLFVIALLVAIINYGGFSLWGANANPDYICKKAVYNSPCRVTNYPSSCPWVKTTEVSYYLIRTECEAGYTKVSVWWNVWDASWRHWADYVSWSNACTITEYDHVAPVWAVE